MMNKRLFIFLILLFYSCYKVPDRIDPQISYQIQDHHFQKLTSAFAPLSEEERASDWGKEVLIAKAFADELDLYRALFTFKRAKILISDHESRKNEIQYDILLCYFLGKRYDEMIESFEKSDLAHVDKTFPAYHDLLLILYEAYREMDDADKQVKIIDLIQRSFPETNEELKVSLAIRKADLAMLDQISNGFQGSSYLDNLLGFYGQNKKSVAGAQALNALIPGAGYLYIGQKKSAMTAFLLNGLFITAAVQFFLHKHVAAGIITTGFEAGWYFGGIYGAGEEAKYYNERLYERASSVVLNEQKLFPALMLNYAF